MNGRLLLLILWCVSIPLGAVETLEYVSGEDILVELRPAPDETNDHHRTFVFLGAEQLAIKRTWSEDDLLLLKRGNTVTLGLYNPEVTNIPVTIIADNGVLYQLQVRPASGESELPSVTRVRAVRGHDVGADAGNRGRTDAAATHRAGGHWEHSTGQVIQLHKHIRGGRRIRGVAGRPLYDQDELAEGRRVLGRRWAESDEFRMTAYHAWTMGNVEAVRVGITYTGRAEAFHFNFQDHRTDASLAIWPERFDVLDRKDPGLTLPRGEERLFLYYRAVEEGD